MTKKVAILTSGGDSPGMNTVIKAVVNTALNHNITPFIVKEGYYGLYHNMIEKVTKDDVKDIDNKAGTYIYSARFPEFTEKEMKKKAIEILKQKEIDSLIVIGGDGSYKGANQLSELGLKTIGIPGTIDGDIAFNDFTIGFSTALDTIVNSIDSIKSTMTSHHRIGIVEVMGRYCGRLALSAAIITNAEILSIPEKKLSEKEIIDKVIKAKEFGLKEITIIVTENLYDVFSLAKNIEKKTKIITKSTILGYVQRGGKPSPFERLNAYKLGAFAIEELLNNKTGIAVSVFNNKLISTDINKVVQTKSELSKELLKTYELTKSI